MRAESRAAHLPASYLWSNKCSKELDPLLKDIREEIYEEAYSNVDFQAGRWTVAPSDAKKAPSTLLVIAIWLTFFWIAYLRPDWLLKWANRRIKELIQAEDENSNYLCISGVNKALNQVAEYFMEGPDSTRLQLHRERIAAYVWMGETGMTGCVKNGTQVWDTAFSIRAASEAGLTRHAEFRPSVEKAYMFLAFSQIPQNLVDPYRQPRAGGWASSTRSNGYIVADGTGESLKALLALHTQYWPFETNITGHPEIKPPSYRVGASRLAACVDTLLAMQNSDGGFGTYEKRRAPLWIEQLNSSEVVDRVIVDYSYPECTASVISGLSAYAKIYPSHRSITVRNALRRAVRYLKREQRNDGSWCGSWGICFTYATFFVLVGLQSVGEDFNNSESVKRACEFLVSKQRDDGGWGEHWTSCETGEYVQHPAKSQVVQTAWAVLALMYARYPDDEHIRSGLQVCYNNGSVGISLRGVADHVSTTAYG
jgi:lanosterol synthase